MNNFKKLAKRILLSSLVAVLMYGSLYLINTTISCGNERSLLEKVLTYAYAAPYSSTQSGTCQVKYETYTLAGAYVQVPSQGNSEQSQSFEGYDVYEYFYPANPEKNTEDRKKLYSYNENGSVSNSGNTVVKGERTQMYNEYDSGSMGIASQSESQDGKENTRHYVQMEARSADVNIQGEANLNNSWNSEDESGMGPSVYFNPNSSKMEMGKDYYLSGSKKDTVIETSLIATEEEYFWEEYLGEKEENTARKIHDATAMFYREPTFYITDSGNGRVVAFSKDTGNFVALGRANWNWQLAGITVDGDGFLYLSDVAKDLIIKTKITGEGWKESYRDIDDFQSRLFLDGSEDYRVPNTLADKDSSMAKDVFLLDCGYNSHDIRATSSIGYIPVDPANKKPLFLSTEGCAFGNECFDFNGFTRLELADHAAWNFGSDYFTIDMWVQFISPRKTVALISHADSYLFEWQPNIESPELSKLRFAFINSDRGANGNYTYQNFEENWLPEMGEWYHLSIIRNEHNELVMRVDGLQLGEAVPITGDLLDGTGILQIGGYENRKAMLGKMDNIRIARGRSQWDINYTYRYEFKDPRGIVVAPDPETGEEMLFIVDSGHGRIVKMTKDFERWWTYGEEGSGKYQFKDPSDIYYNEGFFYITDTGNKRVVKVDLAEMIYYFKGFSGGHFEEVYSSGSPGLHGVMFEDGLLYITDYFNGNIIKGGEVIGSKNPWNRLFRFTSPVDIQKGPEGHVMILDGMSSFDFSSHVGDRALDLYGTPQKEGINTKFNTGGVLTSVLKTQGMISLSNKDDWQRWVGDEAGPSVAHCEEIENEHVALADGRCSKWTGMGSDADCTDPDNAPPTECVGQWDWEVYWPFCVNYVVGYDVVEVCDAEKICISTKDTTTVDPNTGENVTTQVETSYVCGCASSHYECFSYCEAEEHICHEGFAVAYEFEETGPPEWAPKDEQEVGVCRERK